MIIIIKFSNHFHSHQTEHFFTGFILLPTGHLNAFAKSYELDSGPSTLVNKDKIVIS